MGKEKIKLNTIVLILMIFTIFGLSLGSFIYSLNTSFPEIKNVVRPLEKARAQTSTLFLSNIHIGSLTSSSATISWETNLLSDSQLNIGRTSDYEMTGTCTTCTSSNMVRTHRITVGNLQAGTTFHYQVISKTESGEIKTSLDRSFTTPTASGDDVAPYVTYIRVDSTNTQAEFSINTSEDSLVTIYYDIASRSTAGAYENDVGEEIGDPFADGDSDEENYSIDHSLTLTSAITSSTVYYYRIFTTDMAGNTSLSGEFSFTSSSDTDHVFSTGQCEGGVPLGGCTADGYYCDVGSATLMKNCGQCGYTCPSGQTCQEGGTCTNDPALTGDPYQCNPDSCYTNGIFNAPAGPGCHSSYPHCDANIILKVKKDRECAKWLTCGTAIEQTNPLTGQKEELCMDLAVCTSLGESGQCNSYVELDKEPQTFRTPDEIDKIKWLTGSINAGLDWQYEAGSPIIRGYYPWSAMEETGEKLKIKNYNFEETRTKNYDIDEDGIEELVESYDITLWSNFSKYPNTSENPTAIYSDWEPGFSKQKENRVLIIEQISHSGQGVRIEVDSSSSTKSKYIASLRIKSSDMAEQSVIIRLNGGGDTEEIKDFETYSLTTGWQDILTPSVYGVGGGNTYLEIILAPGSNTQSFYIDDIVIKPALEVQDGVYLERSCRLYPKDNSLSCEYYDDNGIYNKGWYGYCLQRDPKNVNKCISWWPVDLLYGESNLFGEEEQAGYTGRTPVYMCLESEGDIGNRPPPVTSRYEATADVYYTSRAINSDYVGTVHRSDIYRINPNIEFYDLGTGAGEDNSNDWPALTAENNWSYIECLANCSCCPGQDCLQSMLWEDWDVDGTDSWSCWHNGGGCGGCNTASNNGWIFGIQVDWDENGFFNGFNIGWQHDTGGSQGTMLVGRDDTRFYFKDTCLKVVQVVERGENMAWADTINSPIKKVEDLNYISTTDLSPFGGAVTNLGNPTDWNGKLSAQEPNTSDFSSPFQIRSGGPYACLGDCSFKICYGGDDKNLDPCNLHSDCLSSDGMTQGVCHGVGSCKQKNDGGMAVPCISDTECTNTEIGEDYCVGGAASNRGVQSATKWPAYVGIRCFNRVTGVEGGPCTVDENCGLDEYCTREDMQYFAEFRIRGLFAKSYGIYDWNEGTGRYDFVTGSNSPLTYPNSTVVGWGPPNRVCPGDRRVEYNTNNWDTYCGIAPKIRNIKLGDGTSNEVKLGEDGGKVKLSFNSLVDSQQQPLKRIWIDWGDGNIQGPPADYRSKDDPNNPHVYTHSYTNRSCANNNRCEIKILIEDNWEWCSSYPETGLQYYAVCRGGSNDGGWCRPNTAWFRNCPGGFCSQNDLHTCDVSLKARWDPVDSCRNGGTCLDGTCLGGDDDGRSCSPLIVDLNK